MSVDPLVSGYSWVNDVEGWTVAVMSPRPVGEVLRTYGRDAAEPIGDAVFTHMDDHRGPRLDRFEPIMQVLVFDSCTVALEHNGYSGALPEIARRCSAGEGWFFSVYWNVDAAGMVTQALDGEIVASFEPLYPLAPYVKPWERRPAWAVGSEVEPAVARPVCMAHLERQTGVVVDREWLTLPWPAFRIPEPYWSGRRSAVWEPSSSHGTPRARESPPMSSSTRATRFCAA